MRTKLINSLPLQISLAIVSMFFIAGFFVYLSIKKINHDNAKLHSTHRFLESIQSMRIKAFVHYGQDQNEIMETTEKEIELEIKKAFEAFNILADLSTEAEQINLNKLKDLYAKFLTSTQNQVSLSKNFLKERAYKEDAERTSGEFSFLNESVSQMMSEYSIVSEEALNRKLRVNIYTSLLVAFCMSLALILMIRFKIMAKIILILNALKAVAEGDFKIRIPIASKDEFGLISLHINNTIEKVESRDRELNESRDRLEVKVCERTRAIRSILDNVHFGLFRCDGDLKILAGYSQSCQLLLGKDELEGIVVTQLLGLSQRDEENFTCLYEQVFEDLIPGELTVHQIPSRFHLNNRTLSLVAHVVRREDQLIESILFCLSDITLLEKAEQEAEELRAVVKILRSGERFKVFVQEFSSRHQNLKNKSYTEDFDLSFRRQLHSWKGELRTFGLNQLAIFVHNIEDKQPLLLADLLEFEALFKEYLSYHADIIGINYGEKTSSILHISDERLETLERSIQLLQPEENLKVTIADFIDACRSKPVREMLNPLDEICRRLAIKLGKKAKIQIDGLDLFISLKFRDLLRSLDHLLRNSLDHGIESPGERGEKASEGSIYLSFKVTQGEMEIYYADDGRGIDLDKVAEIAVERSLLTRESLLFLSDEEKIKLVFHPGLSTARSVSDISGRGIGMCAVEECVLELKGKIRLESKKSKGIQVFIVIPTILKETA